MSAQKLKIEKLVSEYHNNPIGIDVEKPRLSWQLASSEQDVMQTAYEIRVANSASELKNEKNLLWSSGKVMSDASVNIVYGGKALQSMQRAYWQVRVWDTKNKVSN
jgi:alpha-L-rhamnosidase